MEPLNSPINPNLPFITYGSFKPGELRFSLIKSFVASFETISIVGRLKEKDGIPIFYNFKKQSEKGEDYRAIKVYFKKGKEHLAYQIISGSEPNTYYQWTIFEGCNLLKGIDDLKGLKDFMDFSWSFKHDPYFSQGLISSMKLKNSELSTQDYSIDQDFFRFFCNQAAYMLLWTIIERFCALKYGNIKPTQNIKRLAEDSEINWNIIVDIVNRSDIIYRSNEIGTKEKLTPRSSIKKILNYYYSLRSNMVHRGKNAFEDIARINKAFDELYQIVDNLIKIHKS